MAEIPPQTLLQMWAVVGELRAQVREQGAQIRALQTAAGRCSLMSSARDCPRSLLPQTPGCAQDSSPGSV